MITLAEEARETAEVIRSAATRVVECDGRFYLEVQGDQGWRYRVEVARVSSGEAPS